MNRLLYEWPSKGNVCRAEVCEYKGRSFLNIREWYLKDGEWTATKAGVTLPLGRAADLAAALATVGPEDGS